MRQPIITAVWVVHRDTWGSIIKTVPKPTTWSWTMIAIAARLRWWRPCRCSRRGWIPNTIKPNQMYQVWITFKINITWKCQRQKFWLLLYPSGSAKTVYAGHYEDLCLSKELSEETGKHKCSFLSTQAKWIDLPPWRGSEKSV